MKTISVRELQKRVRESVNAAQSDRVVITCSGKPAAVLVGVEGDCGTGPVCRGQVFTLASGFRNG